MAKKFIGYNKGINLGGWLSQCGEENYNDEHYSSFIKSEDFAVIASWGLDHVRVPVDYNVFLGKDGEWIESGFGYIDFFISECRKNGLKMVLDLHKAPGYVFDNENDCDLFSDAKLQDEFVRIWDELSRRYGRNDDIAFELLNEITARETAEIWNVLAERTVKAIRKNAPETKIIIGGIFNSSLFGLTLLPKPFDDNIVYTYHCYSPLAFTHQKAPWVSRMPEDYSMKYPVPVSICASESNKLFGSDFDSEFDGLKNPTLSPEYFEKMFGLAFEISEKFDVPMYCGEYGVIDRAEPEDALNWYKDINAVFKAHDIPRAAWTYKKMDFGITDEHYSSILDELIKLL